MNVMRATIKMIAEKSGVSVGTVDRVLHNRAYVKEDVRKKVLAIIKELNYKPNKAASALALSSKRKNYVVIVPNWEGYVLTHFDEGIVRAQMALEDYNVRIEKWLYEQHDIKRCNELLEEALAQQVDGVALCGAEDESIRQNIAALAEQNIPVITFNSDVRESERAVFIGENATKAGRVAAEMLSKYMRAGEETLIVYNSKDYASHQMRVNGFIERLTEVRPQHQCTIVEAQNDRQKTFEIVTDHVKNNENIRYVYMVNLHVDVCVEALAPFRARDIRVCAHDTPTEIVPLLKEGTVDFTIGQDLAKQCEKAVNLLFLATQKKLPEQTYYYTESPIYNAENIEA